MIAIGPIGTAMKTIVTKNAHTALSALYPSESGVVPNVEIGMFLLFSLSAASTGGPTLQRKIDYIRGLYDSFLLLESRFGGF